MTAHEVWSRAEQDTVTAALARSAGRFGPRVFLDFSGETYTYADVDRESSRLARGLIELGVRKGDAVATILDNNLEAVLSWFAINKAGAVSVPVNTAYKGEFLRHQLNDCGANIVIAESDYAQRVVDVEAGLSRARILLQRDGRLLKSARLEVRDLRSICSESHEPLPDANSPGDLALLIYTAGTTGPSKGCMISHGYYTFIPTAFIAAGWFTPGDRIFGASPLFHFSGQVQLVENALVAGGSVVVEPSFSATTFMARARETGATALFGMGAMAVAVLAQAEAPGERDHSIRQASWIPMTEAMQQQFYARFGVPVISEVYGQSECWPATLGVVGAERKAASLGQAIPGVDIRLVDDQDRAVPAGEVGEICIRTDRPHMMFDGYWNNPEATVETFRYLWHHTGDNGRFDEDGFLYFADRKKDSLRRRGENVSSIELEQAIMKHPAVAQAAAHAVPSELTEDDIKVCLVLAPGASPTIHELFDFFKSCLPYYAVPRYVRETAGGEFKELIAP